MKNQLLFSELLASKLCHDFAGIVGAVDSCAELLTSADVNIKDSALQLLSINSRKLVSRLKFYRYAYGNINSLENININEIQMLSNQCLDLASQQIILQLRSNLHHTILDKLVGKIIICLIIVAFEHIIKNGRINCQCKQLVAIKKLINRRLIFYWVMKIGIISIFTIVMNITYIIYTNKHSVNYRLPNQQR